MNALFGSYNHSVDAKNRIRIPSKLKSDMGLGSSEKYTVVFQNGTKGCVCVYTEEQVNAVYEKLKDIPEYDEARSEAKRQYLAGFENAESDPQGRVVLPLRFRKFAGIQKDIVICGAGDHLEIWADSSYTNEFEKNKLKPEDIRKLLGI